MNTVLNASLPNTASNIDTKIGVLINTHAAPGRVFQSFQGTLGVSKAELLAKLSEITNKDINDTGYVTFPSGVLYIAQLSGVGDVTSFTVYAMVYTGIWNDISNFIGDNSYSRPVVPGVYSVNIDHYYLDRTNSAAGELKCVEHYRTNKSFKDLLGDMYPKIDIQEMMKQYSNSNESLIILSGQPGTGKTCVAKMMMAAHSENLRHDINVVYVKDRDLLARDSFWAMLSSNEPHMLILDDLDSELLPRTQEDPNPIVSNMLSFSDGIFDVRTKILITTNLTDSLIDGALVRPGRCFDTLSIPQLNDTEARNVWVNTLGAPEDEFTKRLGGINPVSQAAVMSEYERFAKSKAPTYLRDPSISIRSLIESKTNL